MSHSTLVRFPCLDCGEHQEDRALYCARCREKPAQKLAGGADVSRPLRTSDPSRADVSEAEEQTEIIALLELHGWKVWRIGQRNAEGTQDAGVPDIYALHRRFGGLWIEAKKPHNGRLRVPQREFREWCLAARVPHVWGALPAVQSYLASLTGPL